MSIGCWSIYPIGYFLGYLGGGADPETLNWVYNLDYINKIAFGVIALTPLKQILQKIIVKKLKFNRTIKIDVSLFLIMEKLQTQKIERSAVLAQ